MTRRSNSQKADPVAFLQALWIVPEGAGDRCKPALSPLQASIIEEAHMRTLFAVLLLAILLPYPAPSMAQPFSQVIVFGDSNVDSGYYKALSSPGGGTTYNSLWASAVANGAGAPTTNPGLMNSQFLARFFNLSANPANTTGGTNYATSGAKNETSNSAANGGFTAAIPTGTQIRSYVAANGGVADGQALYLIWSGDNDVTYANGDTGTSPPPDPDSYVMEAAEDLNGDILFLKNAGAQHIIVAGLAYDFPTGNSTDAVNRRALKLLYTNTLFANLTQIGVSYHPANTDALRLAIAANPANYGFTSVGTGAGQMACTQPAGVTTAWALLCSSNPAAPSTWTAPAQLTDLFADDQHLATAGQLLMARLLRNLVVPWAAVHDANGDGKSDIYWRDNSGDIAIWLMNGATVVSSGGLSGISSNLSIVAVRDFNSDGKFDLLWRDTSGNTSIWFLNGTNVTSSVSLGNISNWSVAGTGDFNGDGYGDILWQDSAGDLAVWLMGSGGQVIASGGLGNVPTTTWAVVGVADFNGDGKSDILWRDTSGDTAIWFMNGTSVNTTGGVGNIPPTWSVVGTGDFNNDGYSDILWQDMGGDVALWLMNGASVTSTGGLGTLSRTVYQVATIGDFNGDGNSDILWRDTSGNTSIWFMNGTSVTSALPVGNIPTNWRVQSASAD
jgi:phospholipase/lecithinase/hemolysin